MKKILFFIALIIATATIQAQNYLISFAANGTATSLDSVKIENLTQSTKLTIQGTDILNLVGETGIIENSSSEEVLSIIPNPMDDKAILSFNAKEAGNVLFSVFDLNGRTIFQANMFITQGKQNHQIYGLSKGVYIIKIQGNSFIYSSKLICLNSIDGELKIDNVSFAKDKKDSVTPKNTNTTVAMNYTSGDNLRFTGYSFNCFNIVIDIPTSNKTINFNFATTVPVLNTIIASSVTSNSASTGGNITSNGSCNVTARGVCYSTNPNPTAADFIVASGNGTGQFTTNLTGLASGVKYYAKAYATNNAGTNYGNEINFTTLALPTITTNNITSITNTTANCGGIISSDGGDTVTARGVCWSTSQPPTISDSKTINGTGTGSFSSGILGLTQNTTYYVRAYATNSVGTAYGNQVSFTTTAFPTLTTTIASSITITNASTGGDITNDGGSPITSRGVCWSKNINPTTVDSVKTNGIGSGVFTCSLNNLTPNTTYYVRAFAINSSGTEYGNQISFTTNQLAIGDNYQGGIVAYILQSGNPGYIAGETHGLIATTSDLGTYYNQWYNGSYVSIGATLGPTSTTLGSGNLNTTRIVTVQGNGNYAAKSCYDLIINGYSDWYLPSKDELYKLYLNKSLIGGFPTPLRMYWSSSESLDSPTNYAITVRFEDGNSFDDYKNDNLAVRPVRSF
ncbi:MAG: T9SS type A sorting domain-containing protein [Bacteroidota bacterium]